MKTAFGFITVLLYFLQRVNCQACPDGSNVAKMCVSGTYTGQTVLLDTASYNSSVADCTCTFETTSSILKLITYVAPNYQGCNSALRLYSSSGNNIRFQCLMSGTYLDTSAHKYGVATFETYGEAYDTNYCLLLEIAGSIADTITVKCTGNPEIGSDVISTMKSPEATSTIELAMDITTTETTLADVSENTNTTTQSSNTTETTSADIINNTTDITNNTTESSIVYKQDYTVSSTSNANIFNTYPPNITQSVIDKNTTETTLADVNTNNTTTTESIITNTQYYTVTSTKDSNILNGNPFNETVSIPNENTTESTSEDVYTNNTTESNIVSTQDFTTSSARDANISNASPINVTVLVVDKNTTETISADDITNNTTESSIVNTVSTTRDANILNANPVNITVSIVDENTTYPPNITQSVIDENTKETTLADVNTNHTTTTESIITNTQYYTVTSTKDSNILNGYPLNETVSIPNENTTESTSEDVYTNNTTESNIVSTQDFTTSSARDANISNASPINVTVLVVDKNLTETISADDITNNTTESSIVNTVSTTRDANILNANPVNITVSTIDENTTETTSAYVYTNNNTTESSIIYTHDYTTTSARDSNAYPINETVSVVNINTAVNETETEAIVTSEAEAQSTGQITYTGSPTIGLTPVNIESKPAIESIIETTTESNPATDGINVMSTEEVSAESLSNTSTESESITTDTYTTTTIIANIQSSTNKLVHLAEDMTTTSLNVETSYQTTAAHIVVPSLIPELNNIDTNDSVDLNVIPTEGISQNYSSTDTDTIVSDLPNYVPDAIHVNTSHFLNNISANLDYAEALDNNQTKINDVTTTESVAMNTGTGIVTGTILFNGGGSDKPKTIQMIGAVTSDRLMNMEEPDSNSTQESLVLDNTYVATGSMKFTSNVHDTSNLSKHFTTQDTTGAQADNAVSTTVSVDLSNSLLTSTTPPLEKSSVKGPIHTNENDVKHHGLQFPATQKSIISVNTKSNEMATHNISAITDSFYLSGDNAIMNSSELNASNDIVDSDLHITVNDTYNVTAEAHSSALPAPEFKETVLDFGISNSFANEAYSPRTMNTLTFTTSEARYVTENTEPVASVPKITERVIETSAEVPTSHSNVVLDEYANNITSIITVVNVTDEHSVFTTEANNIVISTEVETVSISYLTDQTNVHNETIAPNNLDVSTAATSLETEPIQTDISVASTVQQTSVRSVRSNEGLDTDVTTTASTVSETTTQRMEATSQQVLNVESVAMINNLSPDASHQLNNSDPYSLQENNTFTLAASTVNQPQTEVMFERMSSNQEMASNFTSNQERPIKGAESNQILTTPSEWMSFGLDQHNHLDIYSLETKVTTPSLAEPLPLESNMSEFTSNQDVFINYMSNHKTMVPKSEEQTSTTPSVSYTSEIAQNNSIVSTVSTVTNRTTAFVTEDTTPAERVTKVNLRALFASAGGAGLPSPTDASILSENTANALVNSNLLLATTTESNGNISYSTVASTERSGVSENSTISTGSSSTASFGTSSTFASETSSNALDGTNSSILNGTISTVSATVSADTSSTLSAGTVTFTSEEIIPVDLSNETIQPIKEYLSTTINLTTSTSLTGMEIISNEIVNLNEKYTSTSVPDIIEGDMIVKETAMINNAEKVINVPKEVVNPDAIDQNALDDFLANLEKQIIKEATTIRTAVPTTMNQADSKSSPSFNDNLEIIIEKTTLTSSDVYKSTDTLHTDFNTTDTSGDLMNVPTTPVQFFSVVDDTDVVADNADPRQVGARRKTSDSNDTNVTFDTGRIGALDIDMNNDTYIMVVGGIVGLVVLAVVIGIFCHRGRKRRSEKGNISANGVDPGTHQNQAFDNSSADPEQGTNTVDIKNEASSGPTEQNGDTTIPQAEEHNGNIDL